MVFMKMIERLLFSGIAAALMCLTSCSTVSTPDPDHFVQKSAPGMDKGCYVIKTTAYCHHEADSLKYGKLTARGTHLRSKGEVRSAAADWSRYPVGTKFRIVGQKQVYEVDDYGSALVGTDTIDIYQPTLTAMRRWGAPVVGIEVIQWGSFNESLALLKPRAHKAEHVRDMLSEIETKIQELPMELRDGFPVTAQREPVKNPVPYYLAAVTP